MDYNARTAEHSYEAQLTQAKIERDNALTLLYAQTEAIAAILREDANNPICPLCDAPTIPAWAVEKLHAILGTD